MKNIKKKARLFIMVLLIILACFGVGLSGGVLLPPNLSRRDRAEAPIELIDEKHEKKDELEFKP